MVAPWVRSHDMLFLSRLIMLPRVVLGYRQYTLLYMMRLITTAEMYIKLEFTLAIANKNHVGSKILCSLLWYLWIQSITLPLLVISWIVQHPHVKVRTQLWASYPPEGRIVGVCLRARLIVVSLGKFRRAWYQKPFPSSHLTTTLANLCSTYMSKSWGCQIFSLLTKCSATDPNITRPVSNCSCQKESYSVDKRNFASNWSILYALLK